MADFRTIVNYALRESGITQDDLTTGNFASPPDPILTRFKSWCQQAYEDIQTDRRDWEFMQATGVARITPKIEVYGADSTTGGGNISDFNGAAFRLHSAANDPILTGYVLTITDGSFADGDVEGELTCQFTGYTDTKWIIEPGDLLTTATDSATAYFSRWGRYNLSQAGASGVDEIDDIAEFRLDSFARSDYQVGGAQSDYYTNSTYTKLGYVSQADWYRYAYDRPKWPGPPLYFTLSNDGKVEFYPPLDKTYHISFEYTRTPQTLSAHGDTPTYLPARFHNAIAWRAVMYWAEYEGNGQQYNRAKARYTKFETEMIRDLLPPVKVSYDARQW